MQLTRRVVVTNHGNHDIEWLKDLKSFGITKDDIYIYERSGNGVEPYQHLGKVFESPNVGNNIYDYGRYIVENYDNLADINILIKGNIPWRTYTNKKRFKYALTANWFVPINNDPIGTGQEDFYHPWSSRFYVNDSSHIQDTGRFMTTNQEFVDNGIFLKYFKNIKEFLEDLFIINKIPEYLSFCPGGNVVVPKNNILKYSKNFYKKMMNYTDYTTDPMEAHYYERILSLMWQGCLLENG